MPLNWWHEKHLPDAELGCKYHLSGHRGLKGGTPLSESRDRVGRHRDELLVLTCLHSTWLIAFQRTCPGLPVWNQVAGAVAELSFPRIWLHSLERILGRMRIKCLGAYHGRFSVSALYYLMFEEMKYFILASGCFIYSLSFVYVSTMVGTLCWAQGTQRDMWHFCNLEIHCLEWKSSKKWGL